MSLVFKRTSLINFLLLLAAGFRFPAHAAPPDSVLIGNYLRNAPCGIAWIVNDSAAFVLDTGGPYVAGTAAPDDSYHSYRFNHDGANIVFEWGRLGDNAVGRISTDKPTELNLTFSSGWPGWKSTFTGTPDGATAIAETTAGPIHWTLRTSPASKSSSAASVTVALAPSKPLRFVAGLADLPDFPAVDDNLERARAHYQAVRPKASGECGDFLGVIADNMNNSRLYANDNHLLAHSVSRGWSSTANGSPYFCWDSFFTANLAALDDPAVARNTVRAILSCQSSEGLVPNFGHWNDGGASMDRSQPPVGSLCVWKMHQRYPGDRDFLNEVYPKLVRWHDWWPKYRDAKHDGLLEWGSANGDFQSAQYETGWDDNLHYASAAMRGPTMDCYSIDLSSMWAMDAHYLALMADFLGHVQDAKRFRHDEAAMNKRINRRLWNDALGCYCSRFWDDTVTNTAVKQTAFGPGFDGEYFDDETMGHRMGARHEDHLDFNWAEKPPLAGMTSGDHWSARWKAIFTAPKTGNFRFSVSADDGVRVIVGGKTIIDDWSVHPAREKTADVSLAQGQSVPVVVEYYQHEFGSELHFFVTQVTPTHGAFLTRLTPMNFYALSAGAPNAKRATRALATLTNPAKFWGKYLLPTLAYNDPDYHQQEYWRGDVWGPPNYITWVGLKKYATPEQLTEFADRNVSLFMQNWQTKGVCGENYLSTDGTQNRDPHYTWGALLNLIGLESIVDVNDAGEIVLNGAQTKTMTLANIPLLGRIYEVKTAPGSALLLRDGKTILKAQGKIIRARIR